MDLVMGFHDNLVQSLRDIDTGQTASKRLFVNVRVMKRAMTEHLAIGGDNLPAIGIVVPAGIGMS